MASPPAPGAGDLAAIGAGVDTNDVAALLALATGMTTSSGGGVRPSRRVGRAKVGILPVDLLCRHHLQG